MVTWTLIDDMPAWLPLTVVTLISAGCGDESHSMTQRKASAENYWRVRSSKINDATVISINGFKGPYALTITDSGRIYVADVRDGRIT